MATFEMVRGPHRSSALVVCRVTALALETCRSKSRCSGSPNGRNWPCETQKFASDSGFHYQHKPTMKDFMDTWTGWR